MSDRKDPPIQELEYTYGLNVIDIGELRVSRGQTRRPHSVCLHRRLTYDPLERRIWCRDCERDIDGFDAFTIIAEQCHEFYTQNAHRAKKLEEAEKFQARSIAVKELDRLWRSRNTVPCCPHCKRGLLPEDMKHLSGVGVEYERARRKKLDQTDTARRAAQTEGN